MIFLNKSFELLENSKNTIFFSEKENTTTKLNIDTLTIPESVVGVSILLWEQGKPKYDGDYLIRINEDRGVPIPVTFNRSESFFRDEVNSEIHFIEDIYAWTLIS